MMNLIDVEVDVIIGLIASNLNETYRPIFGLEDSNKTNNFFLHIKVSLFNLKFKLKTEIYFF